MSGAGTAHLGPHHPAVHAQEDPERPAQIWAPDGSVTTYAQLAHRTAQGARALHDAGLAAGDHIAVLMENHPRFLEICWAALRSGLYCTPVSTWLTVEEATAVVADSGATVLLTTPAQATLAGEVLAGGTSVVSGFSVGGDLDGFRSWEEALDGRDGAPLAEEPEGSLMLYSSGTTSRPKGVRRPLSGGPCGTANPLEPFLPHVRLDPDTVHLAPAPLYHAAPLGWSLGTQRMGGTAVLTDHFDPVEALAIIERHRVTHVQLVPTMMVRIMKLDRAVRDRCDLSSLRHVVHAAAPCPPVVKEQMIAWLGPVVDEYYSGTEGSGITFLTSEEWLEHRGSVGRAILGELHVTDEDGTELAPGEEGIIWFSSGGTFSYHGDREATARRVDEARGWTTLDDVGYVDADGYLHLTDRRAHMIISGGVNISPREVEDVLIGHAAVADAAVLGVPDDEFGERVVALVQPVEAAVTSESDRRALAEALLALCRERLARYKCPREIELTDDLPRLPTGKLAKRLLRDHRWQGRQSRLI